MSLQPSSSSIACNFASVGVGIPRRTANKNGSRSASATLAPVSVGFCGTYATSRRHCCGVNSDESRPSRANVPRACGFSSAKAISRLDLPSPDGPAKSTISPASMERLRSAKISRCPPASPWVGIEQRTPHAVNRCTIFRTIRRCGCSCLFAGVSGRMPQARLRRKALWPVHATATCSIWLLLSSLC